MPAPENIGVLDPQTAAERAVKALGCGFDLTCDLRFSSVKPAGNCLVQLGGAAVHDISLPGGVVVPDVPVAIRCDKGERTRFRSDVLPFHQMSEQFNQHLSLSGKIPSGLFNAMFDYRGCWQKEASITKSLCIDGWLITLYAIELERFHIKLCDKVKRDVPSSWDPNALVEFIEKYGTHIIVGVKMGGKDEIYVKQQKDSSLEQTEVSALVKRLADEAFSEAGNAKFVRKQKNNILADQEYNTAALRSIMSSVVTHMKEIDIVSIHVRRGGISTNQSHDEWLRTVPKAPDVISMSFVPITSLLNGVTGSGFLSHAMNLYLRYKPPIEDLCHFLEFQLPREWAPLFGEIPIGPQRKRQRLPSLQFTFMGPKLYVNTTQVDSGHRPVTGLRLFLEGKRNDRLAIHLQHLSALPGNFQLSEETECCAGDASVNQSAYYEPIKWSLLSHICTAPVQYSGALTDVAPIVTKAWLEVREVGMKRVLFLRLGFSNVASMKIRRSQWDGPANISKKSGTISGFFSGRLSAVQIPEPKPKIEVNSAIFPGKPPVPLKVRKLLKFVDTSEMMRGPDDTPGYWVVTGAKLCAEGGKISLNVKYSLLIEVLDNDL